MYIRTNYSDHPGNHIGCGANPDNTHNEGNWIEIAMFSTIWYC
jgi:hypothetical protein